MKRNLCFFIIFITAIIAACSSKEPVVAYPPDGGNLVIYNGTILTMAVENQKLDNTQALLIKDGVIKGIGKTQDIISQSSSLESVKYLNLNGKTLLPGFIEPHAHLMLTANGEAVTNLMPCLPDKYQKIYELDYPKGKKCKNYINEALGKLAKDNYLINGWYIGNGLDPSRMLLDNREPNPEWIDINRQFLNQPAHYIQSFNSEDEAFYITTKPSDGNYPFDDGTPLFILDQSGHLAYVNEVAFQKSDICSFTPGEVLNSESGVICVGTKDQMEKSLENAKSYYGFPDGAWGITCKEDRDICSFSGLLNEESSYQPFVDAIADPGTKAMLRHARQDDPALKVENRMVELMKIFSRQGVTTFVEGGGSSVGMIEAYKNMVKNNTMAARLRVLYTWDIKGTDGNPLNHKQFKNVVEKIPFEDSEFNGFLSAGGIKLWADGSTQGCSADLITVYDIDGLCKEFKRGHQNYDDQEIIENLGPFYEDGWYLNVHANGDQAIINTVTAFKNFGVNGPEYSDTPLTLIHSTVYDDKQKNDTIAAIKDAQKFVPNLSVSHLIGHVAYWGESMKNELGDERGGHIAPARSELEKGIDVSLHSDMSITPLYPLWFVEQAVTRKTWKYPKLTGNGESLIPNIPQKECMTKGECLTPYRALMAVTAIPAKQHQLDKLGTIERHKIADLVVLEHDPTISLADDIHSIPVACTFINGQKVKASVSQDGCQLTDLPKLL